MTTTEAVQKISQMPANTVPDWIKGMAMAYENRDLASKVLKAYAEGAGKRGTLEANG